VNPPVPDEPRFEAALRRSLGPASAAALLDAVRSEGAGSEAGAAFVGGWVRDVVAGRSSGDVDVACASPDSLIAALRQSGRVKKVVALDPVRRTFRVILPDRKYVDVAAFQGPGLDADLRLRDLRVNAMAWVPGSGLRDPLDGRADLAAGCLQLGAPEALSRDPIRSLRVFRIAAQLGAALPGELVTAARAVSIAAVSPERVQAELATILELAGAPEVLDRLWDAGLLTQALPGPPRLSLFAAARRRSWDGAALRRCLAQVDREEPGRVALWLGWLLPSAGLEEALHARRWPRQTASWAETVAKELEGAPGERPAPLDRARQLLRWKCRTGHALLGIAAACADDAAAEAAVAPYLAALDGAPGGRNPKQLPVPPPPRPLLLAAELRSEIGGGSGSRVGRIQTELLLAQLSGSIRDAAEARDFARRYSAESAEFNCQ
jgi:tRNA nucleotidyltransferase/poly(A) polymerase